MNKDLLQINSSTEVKINTVYRNVIKQLLNKLLAERNDYKLYTILGFCYKKTNRLNKAVYYFEKAIRINQEAFSAYYQTGLCALKLNKTCVALNSFIKAIQANPSNPNAVLALGITHELCEEPDMAFMIYQRLIETTPNFIKAYEKKAELFIKMSHYSDAIPLLNATVKQNPLYAPAYEKLGFCYKKLGKSILAYRCYKKALTVTPNFENGTDIIAELKQLNKIHKEKRQQIKICML